MGKLPKTWKLADGPPGADIMRSAAGTADEPGWWKIESLQGYDPNDVAGPAEISVRTPEQFLRRHVYGNRTQDYIDSLGPAQKIQGVYFPGRASLDRLQVPYHEIRSPHMGGGVFADKPRYVAYSTSQRLSLPSQASGWPDVARRHEWAHATNLPAYGSYGARTSAQKQAAWMFADKDDFLAAMKRAMLDAGASEDQAKMRLGWDEHFAKTVEAAAQAGSLKGLEYGVSGNIGNYDDYVRQLLDADFEFDQSHKPGRESPLGPDPVMQHGPAAGRPAHGYNYLRMQLKSLFSPDGKKTKQQIENATNLMKVSDASRTAQARPA